MKRCAIHGTIRNAAGRCFWCDNPEPHTPGPWAIEPKEQPTRPLYVCDKDGNRVAKCDGINASDFFVTPGQCDSNARLIAASPLLLDACKVALSYLDRRGEGPAMTSVQIFEMLESAIAKAESRSGPTYEQERDAVDYAEWRKDQ